MPVYQHKPVLADEVIEHLHLGADDNCIDGTVGGGGHTERLLRATSPKGRVLGLDLDQDAIDAARKRLMPFEKRVKLIHGSYANLAYYVRQNPDVRPVAAIVLDLGLSSYQLDAAKRGFSFRETGAVDMRFDVTQEETASTLLMNATEEELRSMLTQFGEIRPAKRLAHELMKLRDRALREGTTAIPVQAIAETAEKVLGKKRKMHPATTVFQALRIAVNKELENITQFLPQAIDILKVGGRLAIISYHSLEDRIVKHFFHREAKDCICPPEIPECRCGHTALLRIINKKVIMPSDAESRDNPRSRSARMRVAEKL